MIITGVLLHGYRRRVRGTFSLRSLFLGRRDREGSPASACCQACKNDVEKTTQKAMKTKAQRKSDLDCSDPPTAPLHRFPAPLRCPAGREGMMDDYNRNKDVLDCFCEPPPPEKGDQAPDTSIISRFGLHPKLPQKTLKKTGPLGLSFFVPCEGAEDVWEGADDLMALLLRRDSQPLTCQRLDKVASISDTYALVPDEILGVSMDNPFAVHVTVSPKQDVLVSDMQELALCLHHRGFTTCVNNSALGRAQGQGGAGAGAGGAGAGGAGAGGAGAGAGTGAGGSGISSFTVLADGHGVYADVVITLLSWVVEGEEDPNARFLAYLFVLDIDKHFESLPDDSAEEFAACLGPTLRTLIIRGYNLSRRPGGLNFSLTESGVATERLLAVIGDPRDSVVGHWGNRDQQKEAQPGKAIEVPLSSCSSSALLMARSYGGCAMVVPGSMTIKVSGLPHLLTKDVTAALETDEIFLKAASSALAGSTCVDRSLLRPPWFFVSKSPEPAPVFQTCDITPLSEDDIGYPLSVTVFGPVDSQRRTLVSASNAGRSLLSLLRGELAPDQRYRWWLASSSCRPVDFMAMWPSDSPTLKQRWWAATVQREVLDAFPASLFAGSSGASVVPSESESFFFLLTWSSKLRAAAVKAIDTLLRDLSLQATRRTITV